MASSVPGFSLPKPSLLFPSDYSTRRSLIRISASSNQSRLESSLPESSDSASAVNDADDNPVKLAFAKAKAYEKNPNQSDANPSQKPIKIGDGDGDGDGDVPVSVKLAMEKAREYKKNKGVMGGGGNIAEKQQFSGISIISRTRGVVVWQSRPSKLLTVLWMERNAEITGEDGRKLRLLDRCDLEICFVYNVPHNLDGLDNRTMSAVCEGDESPLISNGGGLSAKSSPSSKKNRLLDSSLPTFWVELNRILPFWHDSS